MLRNLSLNLGFPLVFATSPPAEKYMLSWREARRVRRIWKERFILPEFSQAGFREDVASEEGLEGREGIPRTEEAG